jgi:hypothetical protein
MKVDLQNPKTEADFVLIAMILWYDIWKHNFKHKHESKYIVKLGIDQMDEFCPLCQYFWFELDEGHEFFESCRGCVLDGIIKFYYNDSVFSWDYDCQPYILWSRTVNTDVRKKFAREIFERCRDRFYDLRDLHDKGKLSYDNR